MTQIWTAGNGQLVRRGYIDSTWVAGVIRPDQPGMSGVPDGVSLTSVNGDITITDSGPSVGPFSGGGTQDDPFLLYRLDIAGSINVKTAKYVHIWQCDVHPNINPGADPTDAVIKTHSMNVPHQPDQVIIEQCNVHNEQAAWGVTGILGHGWTSIRNHIYHTEDGLGSFTGGSPETNAYVTTMGDFIEYLIYFEGADVDGVDSNPGGVTTPSSHRVDGTHSDSWQIQGGAYNTALGTYFRGQYDTQTISGVTPWIRKTADDTTATGNGHAYYGSLAANTAIMINQNQSWAPVNHLHVSKCWVDGGNYSSINYAGSGYPSTGTFDNHVIQNNIFYRDTGWTDGYWTSSDAPKSKSPGFPISIPVSDVYGHVSWGGNVWFDTGESVPVRYGTTIEGYA